MIKCLHIFLLFSPALKYILRLVLLFLLLVATSNKVLFSQNFHGNAIHPQKWVEENRDSLRKVLLLNKMGTENYEVSILAALTHYPDLRNTNIRFKHSHITTSMAALPSVGNIFRRHENRKYTILFNDRINSNRAPLISDVSFTAQVGVIGHELAHIVDYKTKSNIRLIFDGLSYYFSNGFKKSLEHKVDSIAIYRGLGEGILAFRVFIDKESNATEKYKVFKNRIYLTSADIGRLIDDFNSTSSIQIILNKAQLE